MKFPRQENLRIGRRGGWERTYTQETRFRVSWESCRSLDVVSKH